MAGLPDLRAAASRVLLSQLRPIACECPLGDGPAVPLLAAYGAQSNLRRTRHGSKATESIVTGLGRVSLREHDAVSAPAPVI
jgi:hypothetical protein